MCFVAAETECRRSEVTLIVVILITLTSVYRLQPQYFSFFRDPGPGFPAAGYTLPFPLQSPLSARII